MDRIIKYTIEEEHAGLTVKEFLKEKHFSSQSISDQKHFEDGIMHNGKRAYVTEKLEVGDEVVINCHEISSSEKIPPIEMSLDILYEDDDLIIINKPADMPVHPSLNNYENTLANGLAYYYERQGKKFVFRCMNRLDRNTTGAVLVAKNPISGAMLSEMVRERIIDKEYVAIAEGYIEKRQFTIDAPIRRVDGSSIKRQVDFEHGEKAITHVTVLEYNNIDGASYTYVSCKLETGRTHQIRVHMASIGHPLVGDGLYDEKYDGQGQLLHCRRLEFVQPVTGEKICVEAELPDSMKRMLTVNK